MGTYVGSLDQWRDWRAMGEVAEANKLTQDPKNPSGMYQGLKAGSVEKLPESLASEAGQLKNKGEFLVKVFGVILAYRSSQDLNLSLTHIICL